MSRRSSRKTDIQIPESVPANAIAAPKKEQTAGKIEETKPVAKSPAKPTKKKAEAEAEYVEENLGETEGSFAIKINRVKAKAVLKEDKTPKPKKAAVKRKAKAEDSEDGDEDVDKIAGKKKATKKRKTKEEKEAEKMPLSARTSVVTLKKAMHIGAHVSGAGGTFC